MQTHILCLIDDIYEDLELWYPKIRLEEAGHETHLVALKAGTYEGKHGYPATADLTLSEVKVNNYCGLLIPGGFMPDKLRRHPAILDLVRDFNDRGKLIAFICHGGWIPISAKILKGKKVTGSLGIKDDLINAGAVWQDQPVVVDGHLVSARTPKDLAPFAHEMVKFLRR